MHTARKTTVMIPLAAICAAVAPAVHADTLPATAYIQDGLVVQYDAIENAGIGIHDANASAWADLTGNGHDLPLAAGDTVGADCLSIVKASRTTATDVFGAYSPITIEFNARPTAMVAAGNWNSPIANIPYIGSFGWDARNGAISVMRPQSASATAYNYRTYDSGYSALADLISAGVYKTYSVCPGYGKKNGANDPVYVNGTIVAKTSGMDWDGNTRSASLRLSVGNANTASDVRSIRIYNRVLTANEIKINTAVDKIRFDGAAMSVIPAGYHYQASSGHVIADIPENTFSIGGSPESLGEPSPAYGLVHDLSAGDTIPCSCPPVYTNAAETVAATCTGWKLYDAGGNVISNGFGTSFTYVHPTPAAFRRLVWQWDMEYRMSVTAGSGGSVSTSGAWLRPGERLAIDAVPDASHEFCRWSDSVNAILRHGHEAFAVCEDGPLEITAIFGGRLYVDGTNGDDATTDGTTPATAYKTIGAAVSAAPSNTVVLVADGKYTLSALVSISKAVTVRSLSGVAEGVRVDGNAARHCFTLNHPQACLDTITIQNGKSDGSSYDYGVNVRIADKGGQVRNCIVRNGNHANYCTRNSGGGAGIGCVSAQGVVVGCVITNNQFGTASGSQQGAGLYMKAGTVVNSFIGYNKATTRGMFVAGAFLSGYAKMANCTVVGNRGITAGGVEAYNDTVRIYNTFIWGNEAYADADVFYGKASSFSNCVARYAINGFCRAAASSCAVGDMYVPNAASPCIDASVAVPGIPLPPRDVLGNSRFCGAAADIGAVEFQSGTPDVAISFSDSSFFYPRAVTLTAATSGIEGIVKYVWDFDGDGVDDAETTDPSATHNYDTPAYSTPRVTVVHAGGSTTYVAPANSVKALPRTVYVNRLSASPAVPYATPETAATTLAAAVADAIDGQDIVLLAEGSPYSVTAETIIRRGVTIRGSTGNPEDVVYRRSSGNTRLLRVANAGALIHSLTLANGTFGDYGNAICIESNGGTLSNCVIRGTQTTGYWSSAAVYASGGKSLVTHCVITNNYCASSASGDTKAAGLHLAGGARAVNCLIAGGWQDANCTGTSITGGAYVQSGHLLNCTIADNSARNIGGVNCADGTVSNCVIAANVSTHNAPDRNNVNSGQLARYFNCASEDDLGGTWATAPVESLFAVHSAGNYSPAAGSVLIDGGAPNAGIGTEDLAGNPRISGRGVDIGCYEYDSDSFQGAFSCDITSGIVPVSIAFSATANGTNGTDRLAYYWDWDGDGATDFVTDNPVVRRDYPRGGDYSVSLTISNLTAGTAAPAIVKDGLLHLCPPTIYVRPSNAAAAFPYDSWENAAAKFQAAVDASLDGVAIVLSNGTHNVSSQIIVDRALDIRGLTGNPADVILLRTGGGGETAGYRLEHPRAVFRDMTFDGGNQNRPGILIAANGGMVTNCVITRMKNYTYWASDGALTIDSKIGLATHCVIRGNTCTYLGDSGKAIVRVLRGRLSNSLIARNTQEVAVPLIRGAGVIDNCTVVSNVLPAAQALLSSFTGGMTNCLFASNVTGGAHGAIFSLGTGSYSRNLADVAVDGWLFGSAEDIFVSPATGNWHLLNGDRNPVRNKGDKCVPFPPTDLDGAPRLVGGPDIGCYENQTEFRTLILLR